VKKRRFELANLGISRGAMVVLGIHIAASLLWMMSSKEAKASFVPMVLASPSTVFEQGHVWTLATSPLFELSFINLLFFGFMMWGFVPRLEHFWGTARFYRFVIITSLAGAIGGVLVGYLTGVDAPITGLQPFMYASIVAFGMTFQKQKLQFFAVLPLTAKQFMYGILVFVALLVGLQQAWYLGGAIGSAIGVALLMISKFSPALAWKKWQIRRARAKLTVIEGGAPKTRPEQQKYLN
jgi:membrane associated rhomboid family serine protease